MSASVTVYDAFLKEYVSKSKVEKLLFEENTLFGLLKKNGDTGMVGKYLVQPIMSGIPQGVGGEFETAQSVSESIGGTTICASTITASVSGTLPAIASYGSVTALLTIFSGQVW